MGMNLTVACPPEHEPNEDILDEADRLGGRVEVVADLAKAAEGAEVVETDTWIFMGDEAEAA